MKKKKILNHYHFNARSYDAGLSRFFAPDLLWEYDPNISPYAYCNNNPINSKDPSGLTGQDERDNPLMPYRSFILDNMDDYEKQIILTYRIAEMGGGWNGVGGSGAAPAQGALGVAGAVNPGGNSWSPFPTIPDKFKSKPENPYNSMSKISNSNLYKEPNYNFFYQDVNDEKFQAVFWGSIGLLGSAVSIVEGGALIGVGAPASATGVGAVIGVPATAWGTTLLVSGIYGLFSNGAMIISAFTMNTDQVGRMNDSPLGYGLPGVLTYSVTQNDYLAFTVDFTTGRYLGKASEKAIKKLPSRLKKATIRAGRISNFAQIPGGYQAGTMLYNDLVRTYMRLNSSYYANPGSRK